MISTLVTYVIIVAILVLLAVSFKNRYNRNYKNEIVSLGVLGTFTGITIGLYHFDVTDIKSSMPLLLEGLKSAFVTSGVGIFAAIILSIFKPVRHKRSEILDALEMVVKDFNKNLTEQFGDNFKQLNESVKSMIVWQENYKTQIKSSEEVLRDIITQLKKVELVKQEEKESIQKLILNLEQSSSSVKTSLETTTDIVKDQMQLLLREANRRL